MTHIFNSYMLRAILCATFVSNVLAAITDLNCTYIKEGNIKYSPKASNCANKFDDKYCESLFEKLDLDRDNDRGEKCFKDGNKVESEEIKQFAINFCPKTCGYCCLTSAFNCQNKEYPRISCQLVSRSMCSNELWKPILTEDCPNVCGFCEASRCVDKAPYCAQHSTICRHVDLLQFAMENCRRTCNYCTGLGPVLSGCGSNPNCPNWIKNGFCTSRFYTAEHKKGQCGKLCNLC